MKHECRGKRLWAVDSGRPEFGGIHLFCFQLHQAPYTTFILIMFGFLLQWPTLMTVIMIPILVVVYVRLARHEEEMALKEFGDIYRTYMARTPGFVPRILPKNAHSLPGRMIAHCPSRQLIKSVCDVNLAEEVDLP